VSQGDVASILLKERVRLRREVPPARLENTKAALAAAGCSWERGPVAHDTLQSPESGGDKGQQHRL